jgi:DNA primase
MSAWIDFKALREQLDVLKVLRLYNIELKRKGTQAVGFCPLPTHQGKGKSPSFSISLERKIFQCFGCGAKGNILELVARLEKLDPANPHDLRRAAITLQEKMGTQSVAKMPVSAKPASPASNSALAQGNVPVLINEPLDFELKNLDSKPPYLLNRGFTEAALSHFGLGYCTKGLFAGRVVIPLRDMQGRLIGYAGRIIFDEAIDDENPKYLFPSKRERNGNTYEFAKSLFVYNGHTIKAPVHDLIVVEGFPSVWWLWQHGFRDVVAVMGSSCSVDQANIIINLVSKSGRVWLLTDGDKAGEKCAADLFFDVGPHRFCKWVKLREGQPTDCNLRQLNELLAWKIQT